MLKKNYSKSGNSCRVTFKLPAGVNAETAALCGDFNDWDKTANPMKRLKDGSFSTIVTVSAPQTYRFRYLLDGGRWENDWEADGYASNEYGADDSILEV